VPGIAGASILGDGRVSLILDVAALIAAASAKPAAACT
jgi:chemotaxis protein histidine kinase CheA